MNIALINTSRSCNKFSQELSMHSNITSFDLNTVFLIEDYDLIIIYYESHRANIAPEIKKLINKLQSKYVALVCISKYPLDVSMVINKLLKKNNNLLVYSKYLLEKPDSEVYDQIMNKVVVYDGSKLIYRIIGFFTRLLNLK